MAHTCRLRKNLHFLQSSTMAHKRALLGLCFLLLTPALSLDLTHIHRLRKRRAGDDSNDDSNDDVTNSNNRRSGRLGGPKFSPREFGDKLRDLLDRDQDDRDDARDSPWGRESTGKSFKTFLNALEQLADRAPDDLSDFDPSAVLSRVLKRGPRMMAQKNLCLTNSSRLQNFMSEVRGAMSDLRGGDEENSSDVTSTEHVEDDGDVTSQDSEQDIVDVASTDDTTDVSDDTNTGDDVLGNNDDVLSNGDTDSEEQFGNGDAGDLTADTDDNTEDNTGSDVGLLDDSDNEDILDNIRVPSLDQDDIIDEAQDASNAGMDTDDSNDDDEDELDSVDMEDIFEKLTDDSIECITGFLDTDDEEVLCRQFSHQSSRVFAAFINSGVDCSDYIDDDDLSSKVQERRQHRHNNFISDPDGQNRHPLRRHSRGTERVFSAVQDKHDHLSNSLLKSKSAVFKSPSSMSTHQEQSVMSVVHTTEDNYPFQDKHNMHSSFSEGLDQQETDTRSMLKSFEDSGPYSNFRSSHSSVYVDEHDGFKNNDDSESIEAFHESHNDQPTNHYRMSFDENRSFATFESTNNAPEEKHKISVSEMNHNPQRQFARHGQIAVIEDGFSTVPNSKRDHQQNSQTGFENTNDNPSFVQHRSDYTNPETNQDFAPRQRQWSSGVNIKPPDSRHSHFQSSSRSNAENYSEEHTHFSHEDMSWDPALQNVHQHQSSFSSYFDNSFGQSTLSPQMILSTTLDTGDVNSFRNQHGSANVFVESETRHAHHNRPRTDKVLDVQDNFSSSHFLNSPEPEFATRHHPFHSRSFGAHANSHFQTPSPSGGNAHAVYGNEVREQHQSHWSLTPNGQSQHKFIDDWRATRVRPDNFFGTNYRHYSHEFTEDLDDAHQMALLNRMLLKPAQSWTTGDLQRAVRLAPDVIGDDFFEDLNDDVLEENLGLLGQVASRRGARPSLLLAFRRQVLSKNLNQLDSATITKLGKGLLSLSEDELDDLSPEALIEADLDDLFDDEDDEDGDTHGIEDEDDDYDDDGVRRLAIGRRMKEATLSGPRQIGRVARFLRSDLDFLESVDPDQLFEAASELMDLDLDEDDAAGLFRRMSQSQAFPALNQFTRNDMQSIRSLMPGMTLSQLRQLPGEAVREALDDLKDVHFGESQARELLSDMAEELEDLTAEKLRSLGRLARGLDADDIEDLDDNIVSDVLDDMDDLGLNDAQRRLFTDKALRSQNRQGALKLMKLPGFADSVSIDDLEDFNDDDVVSTLSVSTTIKWRTSQAAAIVSKVKENLGGRSLRPADIPNLGKLARGLLPKDLDEMVDRPEDVDDLADVLSNLEDELSSAQIDKVLDFIDDKDDVKGNKEVKATASFVSQKGVFLAYLPPQHFKKLDFDDDGKKAFVAAMSSMDTRKLPRAQLKFLAEELMDMIEDEPGMNRDDADFIRLKQLGQFSVGLSAARIRQLSPTAVMQNMDTLGTMPFNRGQAKAIFHQLNEASSGWKCKSSMLASVGPLLQFAEEDTIESLCERELAASMSVIEKRMERHHEQVEERRKEGLWREDSIEAPDSLDTAAGSRDSRGGDAADDATEDDAGKQRLVNRLISAATATIAASSDPAGGRRRRSTVEQLNCGVLRLMRQDVVKVDVSKITMMPNTEFRDCLEVLGNGTKWDWQSLDTLLRHAVEVMGPPSNWTSETLRQAGVLIAGFSPAEISTLSLNGVDALNSVAKHGRLNYDQLKAGFQRWLEVKKGGNVTRITAGELASLSEFVCGLTAAQIGQLPLEVFRRSLDVVGRVKSCSTEQCSAYAGRALQAYGDIVVNWSPAVVGDLGRVLGGFSSPSIQQLTSDQLALVRPDVMAHLPVASLKAMTDSQLKQLSTNQVNSLSNDQYNTLNPHQREILDSKATVAFMKTSDGRGGSGTATPLSINLASLLAAVVFVVLSC